MHLHFVVLRMKWTKHLTVCSPEILWPCLQSSSGLCSSEQCQRRNLYCWSSMFLAVQDGIVKCSYKVGHSILPQCCGTYYLTRAIPSWVHKELNWGGNCFDISAMSLIVISFHCRKSWGLLQSSAVRVWISFALKVHHPDLTVSEVDYMCSMTTKSFSIFMTFDNFCSVFLAHN